MPTPERDAAPTSRRALIQRALLTSATLVGLGQLLACTAPPRTDSLAPAALGTSAGVTPPVPQAPAPVPVARNAASKTLTVGVVAEPVVLDTAQQLSHSNDKLALNLLTDWSSRSMTACASYPAWRSSGP